MKLLFRITAMVALACATLSFAFGEIQHGTALLCLAILAMLDAAEA